MKLGFKWRQSHSKTRVWLTDKPAFYYCIFHLYFPEEENLPFTGDKLYFCTGIQLGMLINQVVFCSNHWEECNTFRTPASSLWPFIEQPTCARHQDKHFAVIDPKLHVILTALGVSRAGFLSGAYRKEPVCLSSCWRPTTHIPWPVAPFIHLQSNKVASVWSFFISDTFISDIPPTRARKGPPSLITR